MFELERSDREYGVQRYPGNIIRRAIRRAAELQDREKYSRSGSEQQDLPGTYRVPRLGC